MSLSVVPDDHCLTSISNFLKDVLHSTQEDLLKHEPGPDAPASDQKVTDAIAGAVSSQAGKTALRDAMDDLVDSAFSIEVSFTNVTHGLGEALKVASKKYQPDIAQFQSDWETYRRTYIDLLRRSLNVVGHARDVALGLTKTIADSLKDETVSIQDKQEEIKGYRKHIAEDIKDSEDLFQGFLHLQIRVTGFQGKLTNWLKAREQGEQQKQPIEELAREIEAIKGKIKQLDSHIVEDAATTLSLKHVSAGASAVGNLCPPVLTQAAGAAIAVGISAKKGEDLQQTEEEVGAESVSLEEQKAKLEELRVELTAPEGVHTMLHPLQSDVSLIRGKLGVFSKIWACIRNDLVEIEHSTTMATSMSVNVKPLFKERLGSIGQAYMALCGALYQYERWIPGTQEEQVLDAIAHAVSSPAGKTALRNAMNDLGDSAFSIDVRFTNITRGLDEGIKEASTEDQPDIAQFQSDWETYRKTYIDLLWRSRKVAGRARTVALDFAKNFVDFLKDETVSIQDKQEGIKGYYKHLEEDIKNSEDLSQRFVDLQTSVTGFQGKLTNWLKAREQGEQQKQRIDELVSKIEAIKEKIKQLNSHAIESAATTLSLNHVSTGALAIGILCPPVLVIATGTAIAAGFLAKKCEDLQQTMEEVETELVSLKKRRAELENLLEELTALQRVHAILYPLQSDMSLIRGKLGVFSQIWTCIRHDLVEIEKLMTKATSKNVKPLFKKRLDVVGQIYQVLCDALYQYETRVHTQPSSAVETWVGPLAHIIIS